HCPLLRDPLCSVHGSLPHSPAPSQTNKVSYEELKRLLQNRDVSVFDVREPCETEEGMIPSAINIPVGKINEAFIRDSGTFKGLYGVDMPHKEDNIVVYCRSGMRGQTALYSLRRLGYTKSRNYTGGYTEWKSKAKKL
uniref:Rhodanese domain-containing protein n=1 Tax=Petromyzon marinus TaxID=7757 RepID=S4RLG2_PETMA